MVEYPLFSVVVLNYNGRDIIQPCLYSVFQSDYPALEVLLVDNASTDDSVRIAEAAFPGERRLRVIRNKENLLYTGGNNTGIAGARGEYIFILNNDTEIDKYCLREIADGIKGEDIGAAQPKIMIHAKPGVIDNTGGLIDRYGYTVGRGSKEKDQGQFDAADEIFFAGGTAMVLKKKALVRSGIFDAKFVAHWEDVDLSWRIRLAGYGIRYIPKAVVYHKVSRTIARYAMRYNFNFHIRKNRIAGLIKNYDLYNLLRFLPVLIFSYACIFLKEIFFDRNLKVAFTSLSALAWNIKALPYLLRARGKVQREIRRVPDKDILRQMYPKSILIDKYLKPLVKAKGI